MTMRTTKVTLVAAMLAGALTTGAAAVSAQSADQEMPGSGSCLAAMHEMMALMGEHMGAPMMGQGSGPGAMMDEPMMPPGSSPGMMGNANADCLTLMGQMMAMMREHMGSQPMGAAPAVAPSPSPDSLDPESTGSPAHAESDASASRVAVTLTDAMRIEPAAMDVPVGVPVTFVVTNEGAIPHEFYLGDEDAQEAHAQEMLSMAGEPMHDEPGGISLQPGETKELTYTFGEPGQYLAGCHVPGHYPAGMRAVITVA
jgi:uncharacterized cupredoxin-like copper-binding protein